MRNTDFGPPNPGSFRSFLRRALEVQPTSHELAGVAVQRENLEDGENLGDALVELLPDQTVPLKSSSNRPNAPASERSTPRNLRDVREKVQVETPG